MFDSRTYPVVKWNLLEDSELVESHETGVQLFREEVLGEDEFTVIRPFGRNGGDGTRVVYQGEDLEEGKRLFLLHVQDLTGFNQVNTFRMVTNGS